MIYNENEINYLSEGRKTMKNKQILFTAPGIAELVENEVSDELGPEHVLLETEYTAVSAGTERANLMGELNITPNKALRSPTPVFPRALGYSGVGRVLKVGSAVKDLKAGDRAIISFGQHKKYNVMWEGQVFKVPYDDISSEELALCVISQFPMEGVRKLRLEIGESCMIMGLGILGLMSVKFAKQAGAVPLIAVDPNPERRKMALDMGADFALDPTEPDFAKNVKELTIKGTGVDCVIEVSGNTKALKQALGCIRPLGRVTLLGCSRNEDTYDMYSDVHGPGVSIIGAHTNARPKYESMPGNWTARDDSMAYINLLHLGRMTMKDLISEIHSPEDAGEVYSRLAENKFPIGVIFDWKKV